MCWEIGGWLIWSDKLKHLYPLSYKSHNEPWLLHNSIMVNLTNHSWLTVLIISLSTCRRYMDILLTLVRFLQFCFFFLSAECSWTSFCKQTVVTKWRNNEIKRKNDLNRRSVPFHLATGRASAEETQIEMKLCRWGCTVVSLFDS